MGLPGKKPVFGQMGHRSWQSKKRLFGPPWARGGNDITFNTANFSATAGDTELVLEAVPDFEQTSVELEICALRIRDVGDGLACMLHKNPLAVTQLSKSSASRWTMQMMHPSTTQNTYCTYFLPGISMIRARLPSDPLVPSAGGPAASTASRRTSSRPRCTTGIQFSRLQHWEKTLILVPD